MERVVAFDIARGMAVALVVLLHASLLPAVGDPPSQQICRMALLLLISGMLAAPAPGRDAAYYGRRALDLLWLLAVWTVVLFVMGGAERLGSLGRELVAPTTHLWYIAALALLTAAAPLLRRLPPALPLALAGAAAAWHTLGGRTEVSGYNQFAHFAVFFFLGFYGRDLLVAALARCGATVGVAAAAGLAMLLLLPFPHYLVTLGSATALLLIAQGLAQTRAAEMLAAFGRRTPDVYLAHVPLLILAAPLLPSIGTGGLFLLVPATIVACLALREAADALGLGWLYQRPCLPNWIKAPTDALART